MLKIPRKKRPPTQHVVCYLYIYFFTVFVVSAYNNTRLSLYVNTFAIIVFNLLVKVSSIVLGGDLNYTYNL